MYMENGPLAERNVNKRCLRNSLFRNAITDVLYSTVVSWSVEGIIINYTYVYTFALCSFGLETLFHTTILVFGKMKDIYLSSEAEYCY